MQKYKSVICNIYERRINNEIAAGEFSADHYLVNALKNNFVTAEGKASLGIPTDYPLSMYEVHKKTVDILQKIRFIYLLSLLEAFFQEYICERDGVILIDLKASLSNETSLWSIQSNKDSSSFYHLPYVAFLLKTKYQIDLSSSIEKVIFEMGLLRNCIVHHDGEIISSYFLNGLVETANFKGIVFSLNNSVLICKKLMAKYIEQVVKTISILDYQ
jgi:hypothetical protein